MLAADLFSKRSVKAPIWQYFGFKPCVNPPPNNTGITGVVELTGGKISCSVWLEAAECCSAYIAADVFSQGTCLFYFSYFF